ncbi:uncharacterized protein [Typha angustifolia]|uniref:uncharacterized protein n=1 Tax=Typha angustifolia TaxID=59011 RepID=UPI003C2D69D8
MGDHVMVFADRLITTQTIEAMEDSAPFAPPPKVETETIGGIRKEGDLIVEEEEPLLQMLECRICQEEDHLKNLEGPCACSGSLKPYKPGYPILMRPPLTEAIQAWVSHSDETTIDRRHAIYLYHKLVINHAEVGTPMVPK